MVLFQDFYHPPHIVVYQYIIILFSPEWCLIRSSQEDLPGELFIFHFPFIYYSPVPVALGYVTWFAKALPVATVPKIPAYRERDYMISHLCRSGHPSTLAVLTKGVPLLPGQALPLPSGGRIQVCFRFAVLHPWPVTLGFGFPSV